MKKNRTLSVNLQRTEILWGWGYFAIELLVIPQLLHLHTLLPWKFSNAELNFFYFFLNFLAVTIIFHRFLGKSAASVRQHPIYFLQAVVLGLAAYYACTELIAVLITHFFAGFKNANDASIAHMAQENFFLMALGTVVLVPVAEECLFRGLLFRVIYNTSRFAAYFISTVLFAAIHILGYWGTISPGMLSLCFLQYLPAGLTLAWAYTKADTIFAPIVIHMIINAIGIFSVR